MRSTLSAETFAGTAVVQCPTAFGPILRGLAASLGSGWDIEATRACDGTNLLMVSATAGDVDATMTVTEGGSGFVLEELRGDRLFLIGWCATLEETRSAVIQHALGLKAPKATEPVRDTVAA